MNELLIEIEDAKYQAALDRIEKLYTSKGSNSLIVVQRPKNPMIIYSYRPNVNLVRMYD